MEYDVRDVLERYGGNGEDAVSGLMRFGGMSFEDAADSVRASGCELDPGYVDRMRRWLYKAGRRG